MQLLTLLSTVRRNGGIVVGLAAFGIVVGLVLGLRQSPVYEATARIAIGPSESVADVNDQIQVGQVLNRTVVPANLSELLMSRRVLIAAAEANGVSVEELDEMEVEATVSPESNIVYVSVLARQEDRPVPMVEDITAGGIELFESIYSVYRAEPIQVDSATESRDPLPLLLVCLIGALVGAVLGVYAALATEKVRSEVVERRSQRWPTSPDAGASSPLPPPDVPSVYPEPSIPDPNPAAMPPPPTAASGPALSLSTEPSAGLETMDPSELLRSNGRLVKAMETGEHTAVFWPRPEDERP